MAAQKAKDAALSARGEALYQRHSQEWKDLSAWYAAGKKNIAGRDSGRPSPFRHAVDDVKAQFKPLRSELGRRQWREMKDFERREAGIWGKLENAVKTVKLFKAMGGSQSSLFNHIVNASARKDALEKLHRVQWQHLNAAQRTEIGAAINKVKKDQSAAYSAHRQAFEAKRTALKAVQGSEKQELRQAWQDRKAERTRAFGVAGQAQTMRKEEKAHRSQSKDEAQKNFNKVRRASGRKRKGRVRKREER